MRNGAAEKNPFSLDWIKKRFEQVTKYIISFRKLHKNEINFFIKLGLKFIIYLLRGRRGYVDLKGGSIFPRIT